MSGNEGNPWESAVITALKRNDVGIVAYLPDTVLSELIERVEHDEDFRAIRVSREEEAIGVLSGAWLGGTRGALCCQSSGFANTFNALGSHSKPVGIPFVGLNSRRGDLGEHNRAQVPAGYAMPRLLDDLGIRNSSLEPSMDIERRVDMAAETAFSTEEPYVLHLESSLTGGK